MHHGLQHDPATLAALPVLAAPPRPVRALDAPAFAALHLQHTLAHPPDHVLFPFLHGLEGDNHAQNTFFASSAFAAASGTGAAGGTRAPHSHPHHYHAHPKRIIPRVPRYRGLVWVVCEEDLERAGDAVTLRVLRRRPQEDGGEGGHVPSSDSEEDELEDDSTSDAESFQDDLALDEDEQDMMMLVGQPDSPSPPPSASPSPVSPASPPLHLLQTPLPPPHPDNIAIASADTYAHPPSPSALSDLGLGITLPEDMGLVAGGISKKSFVTEGEDKDANSYEGVHMHPVARRTVAATDEASSIPSTSSSASSSSLAVDQPPSNSSGSGASLAVDTPPSSAEDQGTSSADADAPKESHLGQTRPQADQDQPGLVLKHPTDPNAPPLLCSTFRPKELLRRKRTASTTGGPSGKKETMSKDGRKDEDWEFVPVRVPDGISLRNFGIQVPIYATLSDIVVYSPYGATPAAIALARRFRAAIHAKRLERMRAAGLVADTNAMVYEDALAAAAEVSSPIPDGKATAPGQGDDGAGESEFLQYNVFVLNATEEELRATVPHLMMRSCGAGVPGGLLPAAGPVVGKGAKQVAEPLLEGGAHTDGPDGHLLELGRREREDRRRAEDMESAMDVDMDESAEGAAGEGMDVDGEAPKGKAGEEKRKEEEEDDGVDPIPNTVDFALREREEMRDLTKASEIISLHPEPSPVPVGPLRPLLAGSTARSSSSSTIKISHTGAKPLEVQSDATPTWDPRVGQVYLGNSGDVPLAPEVPSQFRHAATLGPAADEAARWDWAALTRHLRGVNGLLEEYEADYFDGAVDEDEDEDEGAVQDEERMRPHEDDPFNYAATNDPALGFGYDICVECHDLAPFPSTAHLRAAEEHLAMLDLMWRERWERAWFAREERKARRHEEKENEAAKANGSALDTESSDEGEAVKRDRDRRRTARSAAPGPPPPAPPRPPPHANAVIHLPFPSSPSNTQATMVALMPIVRFLEKWVRPIPVPLPPPAPAKTGPLLDATGRAPTPPELKNLQAIGTVDPMKNAAGASSGGGSRRWSSVSALMPSFPPFPGVSAKEQSASPPPPPPPAGPLPAHPPRLRSMTSPSSQPHLAHPPTPVQARTRPLKILLYSSDGYTESSVPALCLLMAIKGLMLPEAYLELQVEKRRSFFVYQGDLGILRRVEGRLKEEREREKEKERERERERERVAAGAYLSSLSTPTINANGKRTAPTPGPTRGSYWTGSGSSAGASSSSSTSTAPSRPTPDKGSSSAFMGRPAAKSVSFAHAPQIMSSSPYHPQSGPQPQPHLQIAIPSPPPVVEAQNISVMSSPQYAGQTQFEFGSLPAQSPPHRPAFTTSTQVQHALPPPTQQQTTSVIKGRPRASTSPWLPSLFGGDHQSWFNDPRFDGSFPSRVLPFLYLGNLNHASNVYMLHALGITHVVSVGECALIPPPHHMSGATAASCHRPGPGAHFVPGKGPGGQGSLWIEEREGRIKVLDIKGVCDDGIDTLEPQLEPICDWIDKARQEGGQVLVHCRVGVSRSATVTIAYVMKHLDLPLVDAYLIVRSRRLSVLIQPNMRLLYNLCGWEIKLAKERAKGDERKLKKELSRTLTWPYLSKEVHALNEKYLH